MKKEKKKLSSAVVWREARELMWRHRRYLAIGFLLMIVSRLAQLVLPASSKVLIDDILGQGRTELLTPLAIGVGIAALIQALAAFGLSQIIGVTAQRAIADMRRRVQAHVARLPINYFDSTQSGILISRIMTDAEGIRNLVGTGIVQLVGGALTALIVLGILLYLNWQLTLGIVALLAVFGAVMGYGFSKLRPVFRERGELNARITGRLAQTLGGIRVVKAYGAEKREDRIFTRGVHALFRNIASTITGISAVNSFATVIVGAVVVFMIVFGGRSIITGTMTLGDFVMYIFFVGLMAAPVIQIASISTQISEAFAGLDRIRELLAMSTEGEEDREKKPFPSTEGAVQFDDVWFEYERDVPVLRGVSFEAPAGSTTALVGSSGSGKSTLISLVMAFNQPQKGRVLVDGHDIQELRLADYRSHLGVVLQDNFLFDGSVLENIQFARPDASAEEALAAARVAHCDEFALSLPKGYDTVVGERGVKLSGGQRQRVAIARAILADPQILILDEATSSLDSESEAMIQDGLATLRDGRTSFVIAHRLSTIRSADQILVLEHGEIVERGTHQELMAANGRYRELHDRQYAWESDRFVNPGEDFSTDSAVEMPRVRTTRASAL